LLFATMGVILRITYLLIRIAVREVAPPTILFFRTAPAGLLRRGGPSSSSPVV
jgi:hypothetical protein